MSIKSNNNIYSTAFLNQFFEFVSDIEELFPNNVDILVAKTALQRIRLVNASLLIRFWKEYIAPKYGEEIHQGNISFFLSKDYREDFLLNGVEASSMEAFLDSINRFRAPLQNLDTTNQEIVLKYLQNLTSLAEKYQS